jgi:hypothetical protein
LGGDTLLAGKSATVEIGGPGDTLTGNPNAGDQFVFHGAFGQNEITNFNHNDSIWLDHTNITNFQQLMADASQANANAPVIINDHAGDILQLDNVQLSALHASNFHFIV